MKLYARKKMKGNVALCFLRELLPAVTALLGLVLLLPAALCLFYGTGAVLTRAGLAAWANPWTGAALPLLLTAVGTVVLLFAFAFGFYARAWVYYLLDKNQTRPKSLLRPSQALRYCRCRVSTAARKLLWLALYLLPAALVWALRRLTEGAAWLTAGVPQVMTAAAALLAGAGLAFFAVSSSRYYLAEYLLYLNPLLPPGEAVASSRKLTRGKLLAVTARRLSLLPWALAGLLVLPLPLVLVYRRFCAAALCERLYGEDKRKASRPAVVFYVNRRSKITEAEPLQG